MCRAGSDRNDKANGAASERPGKRAADSTPDSVAATRVWRVADSLSQCMAGPSTEEASDHCAGEDDATITRINTVRVSRVRRRG